MQYAPDFLLQTKWDKLLDLVGQDPFTLWVYGISLSSIVVFWIFGIIFTIFDVTNKPKFLRRYKVQPGKNEPVDTKKLINAIGRALSNQFLVEIPCAFLLYCSMCWRGLPPIRELPSSHAILFELVLLLFFYEIGFYYFHRLFHHPYLYKLVHKKHHEWTAPIAITSLYCHPTEHFFVNLLPACLGIFILRSHIVTAIIVSWVGHFSSLCDHGGYHFPYLPSPEFHDFHHMTFNNCFGFLGICDRLHGTDTDFQSSKAYNRHFLLMSLTPVRETIPDTKDTKIS